MPDIAKNSAMRTMHGKEPTTPNRRSDALLVVPRLSPVPMHRLSPAIDEFSLRRTPSRGGTASPAPARGVRKRLHQYRRFDDAVSLLKQSNNVIVLTGAGISTSVGIPDFRSDKGLYQQLSKDLGITEAEEFFSRDYFIHNTNEFFQYVKRVIPEAILGPDGFFKSTNPDKSSKTGVADVPEFSLTHAFLALLYRKRKLLTNYTQNIDGLEIAAGLPRAKFVQCHGSWDTASCMTCGRSSAARKYLPVVFAGNIPFCKCKLEAQKDQQLRRKKVGKKRSWDDFESDHSSDDGTQAPRGLLKPDITFFNERLSSTFGDRLSEDRRKIDLLIIIGTSLKVGPVQDMLYQISPKVPQIFISKERFSGALCNLPGVQVDIELLGECDVIIEELCRRAGWADELSSLCWEHGQTSIKGATRLSQNSPTDLSYGNQNNTRSLTEQLNVEVRPQKKAKSQDEDQRDKNSNAAEMKLISSFMSSSSATMTVAASSPENLENPKQVIRPKSDIPSESHDEICTKTDPSTSSIGILERTLKQETNSEVKKEISAAVKCVKIELVEGTSHQWKVSRK